MHQIQEHPYTLKKKTLMALREQRDTNTVVVGDLNTPLSLVDRSSREKISKETSELHHTLDQIDVVISTEYST
jgi:sugar/nucleoside kinase (ribokinase family)